MTKRKSVLNQIFDGEFYPPETIWPCDPDFEPLRRKIGDEYDYFADLMGKEDRERFVELQDTIAVVQSIENRAYCTEAFRAGVMLMQELIFGERNERRKQ